MVTFRKATKEDRDAIAETYNTIHNFEETGKATTGWIRSIYPTVHTIDEAISKGDMFVEEDNGKIVASARLNKEQVYPTYNEANWLYQADPEEVMVIHTLVVDLNASKNGYGTAFIKYYEWYAAKEGCTCLRLDTNERNKVARHLYKSLGYREADIVPCVFNGIPSVNLVCLEKQL